MSLRSQCTWAENPGRKPRSEAYIEAMHKQAENYRKFMGEIRQYADYLETLLDDCPHHRSLDFRSKRPSDPDASLGQDDDSDFMMGGEDNDQGSDDEIDPYQANVMAICIPPLSLQVR